jgi:D-glycero-alpha-D-manno-heptose-7-phosphate kinase
VSDVVVTRAPTRIDFGGGWTDVPPYSDEMGGYVCNIAIARYATVTVTRAMARATTEESLEGDTAIGSAAARHFNVPSAQVSVHSDFPVGAGLGGSSAAGVAAVAALSMSQGAVMTPDAIAELSRKIETGDLGIAGGRQDHYAAAYGGALGLRFSARGVEVHRIPVDAAMRVKIERQCIVVYTGRSRISGDTIRAVIDAYRGRTPGVLAALARMRDLAELTAIALAAGDLDAVGRLVSEQWSHQRSLHAAIPTPLIDEIIARAVAAGALGAKALGASGGGCVLVIARADRIDRVRAVVGSHAQILDFTLSIGGVERCA